MTRHFARLFVVTVLIVLFANAVRAEEKPLGESWDYAAPMKKVAAKFHGRAGVVLHIGDSITYANPYGQWARAGQGKSDGDKAILSWMHSGKDDDSDGWWLARFDHPSGGRSYTAAGGLRVDEALAGGKQGLPPLAKLLDEYRPEIVVYMLGTNDVTAGRSLEAFRSDIQKSLDLMLDRGVIPIVSTIPPHHAKLEKSKQFNAAIREIAKAAGLPLIDYEREILVRQPDSWNGTLLSKDDVHPTAEHAGATSASAPTAENLRNSGYLLRGWLSVKKIAEVKQHVIDQAGR